MPDDEMATPAEAAILLEVSVSTLARWRRTGVLHEGVHYKRARLCTLYDIEAIRPMLTEEARLYGLRPLATA
jgi:predicted site-specific integrase-resolvase